MQILKNWNAYMLNGRKPSIVLEDMNYYKDQVNLLPNFVKHKEGNKIDEHGTSING